MKLCVCMFLVLVLLDGCEQNKAESICNWVDTTVTKFMKAESNDTGGFNIFHLFHFYIKNKCDIYHDLHSSMEYVID